MRPEPSPLQSVFDDIWASLKVGAYYPGLMLALALPDMCMALESPTGDNKGNVGSRYRDFFGKYLAKRLPALSAEDCYSLRNGVVHQGTFGNKGEFVKVAFTIAAYGGGSFHNVTIEDAGGVGADQSPNILLLDLAEFCDSVIAGAEEWYAANRNSADVKNNVERLVRYRPQGIDTGAASIGNTPVIA